jgi:hypothetical protein
MACQCDASCKEPPLKGKPFCKRHQDSCPNMSPLSGSEHRFQPSKYNSKFEIQDSHNCFAYAFNIQDPLTPKECNKESCDIPFHQPGRKSGFPKWKRVKGKRCPDLMARLMGDVRTLHRTDFTRRCPKGMYKVAAVIDPKSDYHFYRQDADGLWSHKPGGTKVTRRDASKHLIYNPELCDRDYSKEGGMHYDHFCSFMCIPRQTKKLKRGGARSVPTRKRPTCRQS